jgi:hypothetical protein
MERTEPTVYERRNAVFFGFRNMPLVSAFFEFTTPERACLCFFEIEQPGIYDVLEVHLTMVRLDIFGSRLKSLEDLSENVLLLVVEHIDLVHHEHVAEFDLFNQKVDDASMIFFAYGKSAVVEVVLAREVA